MDQDASRNFKFDNFGSELEIEIDEDCTAKCPKCGRKFKLLMQHIKKSTVCKQILDYEKFKQEYDAFTNRRRLRAHWKKELELNPIKTRKIEANKKRKQRERKLNVNTEETREYEATKKRMQRERKLAVDPYSKGILWGIKMIIKPNQHSGALSAHCVGGVSIGS